MRFLKFGNLILIILFTLLLGGCLDNNKSGVAFNTEALNSTYYMPAIDGPKYLVIVVQNNNQSGNADITGLTLTGSSFSIVNRTGNGTDSAYGNYAQCATTANAGLNRVNTLAPGAQCIVVVTGAISDPNAAARTATLTFNTNIGLAIYNQTFNLINTTYLYVGGAFSSLGTATAGNHALLAKCNNGTCENYFGSMSSLGADGIISAIAMDSSGNLYVGGTFSSLGSAAAGNSILLAKCAYSTCQNYFGDSFSGANHFISAITTDNNGNIYVGGNFSRLGNATTNNSYLLAKCSHEACENYFSDTTSGGGSGILGGITTILADSQDNLYVGGYFSDLGTATAGNNILFAKCNNGVCENYFGDNSSGANEGIISLVKDAEGNLYLGGQFSSLGNFASSDPDKDLLAECFNGTCINYFNNSTSGAAGNGGDLPIISAMLMDASGNLYVGGSFYSLNTATAGSNILFAKCNNGVCENYFGDDVSGANGFSSIINTIAEDANGNLYVGGVFNNLGNATSDHNLLAECANRICKNYFNDSTSGANGGMIKVIAVGNEISVTSED